MRLIFIILALFILTFNLFGKGEETGVLFRPTMYGKWSECDDEKKDGIYLVEVNNGLPNGQGTFTINNGVKYVGEWKGGKRHSQGTLTLPDGEKYEWKWKDSKQWNGTAYDKDGNITGKFVKGVFQ